MSASRPSVLRSARPPRGAKLAALLLALLPAALSAQAAPQPSALASLSLPEAVRLAQERNPDFLQQRNDVEVAGSAVRAAYGGLLPSASASTSLGYTAPGELRFQSRVLGEEPESYFSSYSLGLSYQLNGSTLLEPAVQRSQRRAVERRLSGAAARLDAQVTQQYLSVLQAREQVAQAERELVRTEEHVRLAQARLEVGAGTPLDVRRAEVQRGRAEVGLVRARSAAVAAVLTLGQLLGVALDPGVELTSAFDVFDPEWSAGALLELAIENNAVLAAARAAADAARTGVDQARSAYLPSLSLNVGWRGYVSQYGSVDPLVERELGRIDPEACARNNRILELIGEPPQPCPDPTDPALRDALRQQFELQNRGFPFDYIDQPWSASLTVSLPIFNGFSRELQVDRAQAQAADARHQVRAEELRLRQEVATAVQNLETAYQTVLLQQRVRESAAEELRLAQERFRFGAASSVEVTDAQTNLAQAERDLVDAVYDFHKQLAALEALVGRPLR